MKNTRFVMMVAVLSLAGCASKPAFLQKQQAALPKVPEVRKIPIVTAQRATLNHLNLNGSGNNEIAIKPGTTVQANLQYAFHCPECQAPSNQIIVGLAKRSAQACIYQGGSEGGGMANFTLKAPAKPGKYEIRFRILQATDCAEALKEGWHDDNSPAKETTIGTLLVSRKAGENENFFPGLQK